MPRPFWDSTYNPEYVWIVTNEVEGFTDVEVFGTEELAMQYAETVYGASTVSRRKVANDLPTWVVEQEQYRKREEKSYG